MCCGTKKEKFIRRVALETSWNGGHLKALPSNKGSGFGGCSLRFTFVEVERAVASLGGGSGSGGPPIGSCEVWAGS